MEACKNIAIENWNNEFVLDKNIKCDPYIKSAFSETKPKTNQPKAKEKQSEATAKTTTVSGFQTKK